MQAYVLAGWRGNSLAKSNTQIHQGNGTGSIGVLVGRRMLNSVNLVKREMKGEMENRIQLQANISLGRRS